MTYDKTIRKTCHKHNLFEQFMITIPYHSENIEN